MTRSARIVKPSGIILFDDCLSAVDTRTEKEVLRNLEEHLKDRTAVIVTHRIFSLMHFDQVIVLDDGRIEEQGTHKELLELNGIYAEQFFAQQSQGENPDHNNQKGA